MPEGKQTVQEFASKIKAKYPQYKDMDDNELTEKIITKYPVYADQVDVKKKEPTQSQPSSPASTKPSNPTSGVSTTKPAPASDKSQQAWEAMQQAQQQASPIDMAPFSMPAKESLKPPTPSNAQPKPAQMGEDYLFGGGAGERIATEPLSKQGFAKNPLTGKYTPIPTIDDAYDAQYKAVKEKAKAFPGATEAEKVLQVWDDKERANYLLNGQDKGIYQVQEKIIDLENQIGSLSGTNLTDVQKEKLSELKKARIELADAYTKRNSGIDSKLQGLKEQYLHGDMTQAEYQAEKKKLEGQKDDVFKSAGQLAQEKYNENRAEISNLVQRELVPKDATPQQALKIYTNVLFDQAMKLSQEMGYDQTERGFERIITEDLPYAFQRSGDIFQGKSPREQQYDEIINKLRDLAPVVYLNKLPKEGSKIGTEAKDFTKTLVRTFQPGFDVSSTTDEKAGNIISATKELGIDKAMSPEAADKLKTVADLTLWDEARNMIAQSTGMMGHFALTGSAINTILKGNKYWQGLQLLKNEGRLTNVGSRTSQILSKSPSLGKIFGGAVESGITYGATGEVFAPSQDEATIEAGALGGAGGTTATLLLNGITGLFGKSTPKFFQVVTNTLGRAGGEVTEETIQELVQTIGDIDQSRGFWQNAYGVFTESEKGQEFKDLLKQKFPDASEIAKFVAFTAIMGGFMGLPSAYNDIFGATEKAGGTEADAQQAENIVNEAQDDVADAAKQAVTEEMKQTGENTFEQEFPTVETPRQGAPSEVGVPESTGVVNEGLRTEGPYPDAVVGEGNDRNKIAEEVLSELNNQAADIHLSAGTAVIEGTWNGDARGKGNQTLEVDENGNVVLRRGAKDKKHLTKEGQVSKDRNDLYETSLTNGQGNGVPTSSNSEVGENYKYSGSAVNGVFRIPHKEFIKLVKEGKITLGNIGEFEIVISPEVAQKYLSEVNEEVIPSEAVVQEAPPSVEGEGGQQAEQPAEIVTEAPTPTGEGGQPVMEEAAPTGIEPTPPRGRGEDVDAIAKKIVGESAFNKLSKQGYTVERGRFDRDAYADFFGLGEGVQADEFARAGLRLVKPKEKITVYRGVGKNVGGGKNEDVIWVAEDKRVAENYSGNGNVESLEVVKPKNPFPNPANTIYVKGSDVGDKLKLFRDKLFKEGKLTKEQALEATKVINDFVSEAGEDVELYSTKTNKKGASSKYAKALQALGFDGIVQKESYDSKSAFTQTETGNETNTYGIFPENKESKDTKPQVSLQPQEDVNEVGEIPTVQTKVEEKAGFTEGKDLNSIFKASKEKYGEKDGGKYNEAANRLVNPNTNTIIDIRPAGVIVKRGDKYVMLPFTNTDANYKKWELGSRSIDVTEQYVTAPPKESVSPLSSVEQTAKALGEVTDEQYVKLLNDNIGVLNDMFGNNADLSNNDIAEAYHKAKADGSNPQLVKAVEELLTPNAKQDETTEAKPTTTTQSEVEEKQKSLADNKSKLQQAEKKLKDAENSTAVQGDMFAGTQAKLLDVAPEIGQIRKDIEQIKQDIKKDEEWLAENIEGQTAMEIPETKADKKDIPVDDNGTPINSGKWYHGTPVDIKSIDTLMPNDAGLIFFTREKNIAERYATGDYDGNTKSNNVIEKQLSVNKVFDPEKESENENIIEVLSRTGDFSEYNKKDFRKAAQQALEDGDWRALETKEFIDELKKLGYEAIFIDNRPQYKENATGQRSFTRDIAVFDSKSIVDLVNVSRQPAANKPAEKKKKFHKTYQTAFSQKEKKQMIDADPVTIEQLILQTMLTSKVSEAEYVSETGFGREARAGVKGQGDKTLAKARWTSGNDAVSINDMASAIVADWNTNYGGVDDFIGQGQVVEKIKDYLRSYPTNEMIYQALYDDFAVDGVIYTSQYDRVQAVQDAHFMAQMDAEIQQMYEQRVDESDALPILAEEAAREAAEFDEIIKSLTDAEIEEQFGKYFAPEVAEPTTRGESETATQEKDRGAASQRTGGKEKIAEGLDILATLLGAKKSLTEDNADIRKAIKLIAEGIYLELGYQGSKLIAEVKKRLSDNGYDDLGDVVDSMADEIEDAAIPPQVKEKSEQGKKLRAIAEREAATFEEDAESILGRDDSYYQPDSWAELEPEATRIVKKLTSGSDEAVAKRVRKFIDQTARLGGFVGTDASQAGRAKNPAVGTVYAMTLMKLGRALKKQGRTALSQEVYAELAQRATAMGQFISALQMKAVDEALISMAEKRIDNANAQRLADARIGGEPIMDVITRLKNELQTTKEEFDAVMAENRRLRSIEARAASSSPAPTRRAVVTEAITTLKNGIKDKLARLRELNDASKLSISPQDKAKAELYAEITKDLVKLAREYVKAGVYAAQEVFEQMKQQLGIVGSSIGKTADEVWADVWGEEMTEYAKKQEDGKLAELVAKKLQSKIGKPAGKAIDVMDVVAKAIVDNIDEEYVSKAEKKSAIERIAERAQNRKLDADEIQAALVKARDYIDTLPMTETQKDALKHKVEDALSSVARDGVKSSDLRRAIRDGLKDMGTSMRELAKKHYTSMEQTGEALADKLVSQLGVPRDVAEQYEQAIKDEMKRMYGEARKNRINNALGVDKNGNAKPKKVSLPQNIVDKVVEIASSGALDDAMLLQAFADKFGLQVLTPVQKRRIEGLSRLVQDYQGEVSREARMQLEDYLESLKKNKNGWNAAIRFMAGIRDLRYQHILSGVTTALVNIPLGSTVITKTMSAVNLLTNPRISLFARDIFKEFQKQNKDATWSDFKKAFVDGFAMQESMLNDEQRNKALLQGSGYRAFMNSKLAKDKKLQGEWNAAQWYAWKAYKLITGLGNMPKAFDLLLTHRTGEIQNIEQEIMKMIDAGEQIDGRPVTASDLGFTADNVRKAQIMDELVKRMGYDRATQQRIAAEVDAEIDQMRVDGLTVTGGYEGYRDRRIKEKTVQAREQEVTQRAYETAREWGLMGSEEQSSMAGQIIKLVNDVTRIDTEGDTFGDFAKSMVKLLINQFAITFPRIIINSLKYAALGVPLLPSAIAGSAMARNILSGNPKYSSADRAIHSRYISMNMAITLGMVAIYISALADDDDKDEDVEEVELFGKTVRIKKDAPIKFLGASRKWQEKKDNKLTYNQLLGFGKEAVMDYPDMAIQFGNSRPISIKYIPMLYPAATFFSMLFDPKRAKKATDERGYSVDSEDGLPKWDVLNNKVDAGTLLQSTFNTFSNQTFDTGIKNARTFFEFVNTHMDAGEGENTDYVDQKFAKMLYDPLKSIVNPALARDISQFVDVLVENPKTTNGYVDNLYFLDKVPGTYYTDMIGLPVMEPNKVKDAINAYTGGIYDLPDDEEKMMSGKAKDLYALLATRGIIIPPITKPGTVTIWDSKVKMDKEQKELGLQLHKIRFSKMVLEEKEYLSGIEDDNEFVTTVRYMQNDANPWIADNSAENETLLNKSGEISTEKLRKQVEQEFMELNKLMAK